MVECELEGTVGYCVKSVLPVFGGERAQEVKRELSLVGKGNLFAFLCRRLQAKPARLVLGNWRDGPLILQDGGNNGLLYSWIPKGDVVFSFEAVNSPGDEPQGYALDLEMAERAYTSARDKLLEQIENAPDALEAYRDLGTLYKNHGEYEKGSHYLDLYMEKRAGAL